MSPNSEHPLARFLYAILKQKNLKDIDWDAVARDPVLSEPITNGHAARMRYSRFRSSVQGDSKKSASPPNNKNRVSKSKKGSSAKTEGYIKGEYEPSIASYPQFSPASTTSPYLGDTQDDFGDRFPTPFSDDMVVVPSTTVHTDLGNNFMPQLDSTDFLNPAGDFDVAFDDMYKTGPVDFHSQNPLDMSDTQPLADCSRDWAGRFHDQHHF